jgi:hypothetical protein
VTTSEALNEFRVLRSRQTHLRLVSSELESDGAPWTIEAVSADAAVPWVVFATVAKPRHAQHLSMAGIIEISSDISATSPEQLLIHLRWLRGKIWTITGMN